MCVLCVLTKVLLKKYYYCYYYVFDCVLKYTGAGYHSPANCELYKQVCRNACMQVSSTITNIYALFTQPTVIRQDCFVLSCCCWRCEQNWWQVKTVGDRKFQNWTCLLLGSFVQSQNAVWTGLGSICIYTTDVIAQNWPLAQYTEDYWNSRSLLPTLFVPPTRQDKTVLFCILCVSAMWTRH